MNHRELHLNEVNNSRILIVDDNPEIHKDFKKVLINQEREDPELEKLESKLFESSPFTGSTIYSGSIISYNIDSAYSGEEAIVMVKDALENNNPYALIFMDVRMPPGMDGVKAIKEIWKLNRDVEVVMCTAHSDYSWDEIIEVLGSSDHLLFLKKPFNSIEIKQMALALVRKWNLHNKLKGMINNLEKEVQHRTGELEKVNKDLQKANDQKTRFFINLAHETRTPLTLIQNYMEKYISKKGIDTDLQILKHNIDLLLNNMVNFLDVEKLRRGQIFFDHNQITDISELLRNKIILFKEIAKKSERVIMYQIDEGLHIKADPYAVDRIISNIIENAIKYTHKKGVIHVTLLKKEDTIYFIVRDNGIGIPEDQRDHIFLPYYQLSHKKSNLQGIGMGLYIVKRIVDAINGQIEIKSDHGPGTLFTVSLPRYHLNEKKEENKTNFDISPVYDFSPELTLTEEDIASHKKNILLVDDNREMLYFIQSFLKHTYNVYMAESGEEAKEKLSSMPVPDIIISDIMMDDLDGHQLFSYLNESDHYNDIPFIFLTAKSSMEDKLKGLTEGAVDYIYKPFLIEELSAKIESIINNRLKMKKKYIDRVESKIKTTLNDLRKKNIINDSYLSLEALSRKYQLSKREQQVIIFLLDGYINKEISDRLEISLRTVEFHLSNIYKKVGVKNKIELVNILK